MAAVPEAEDCIVKLPVPQAKAAVPLTVTIPEMVVLLATVLVPEPETTKFL